MDDLGVPKPPIPGNTRKPRATPKRWPAVWAQLAGTQPSPQLLADAGWWKCFAWGWNGKLYFKLDYCQQCEKMRKIEILMSHKKSHKNGSRFEPTNFRVQKDLDPAILGLQRICLRSTSVRGEWRVVGRLAVSKGVGSVNVRHFVDGRNPAPVGMVYK